MAELREFVSISGAQVVEGASRAERVEVLATQDSYHRQSVGEMDLVVPAQMPRYLDNHIIVIRRGSPFPVLEVPD